MKNSFNGNPIDVRSGGMILQKTELAFENGGVLNPACIKKGGITHIFYRAVAKGNYSTIGYAQLDAQDKVIFRKDGPILFPEFDYESHGLEDPRIVQIEGIYYLFYTVYDGLNARVAYAESTDLINFTKKGLVSSQIKYADAIKLFNREKLPGKYFAPGQIYEVNFSKDIFLWEKDTFLFPRKINGKFALLFRVIPGIQLVLVDSLDELKSGEFWKKQLTHLEDAVVMNPAMWFESSHIGGGAPPVETPQGWICIYHTIESPSNTYRAGAALLDINDPHRVIGRLTEPLFSPMEPWEKKGAVANVVFPTSVIERDGEISIYYGAADDCIAVKKINTDELLRALLASPITSPSGPK